MARWNCSKKSDRGAWQNGKHCYLKFEKIKLINTLKTILFASQNESKVKEVKHVLLDSYEIKSLNDIGFTGELDEPFDNFIDNAKTKAKQGYDIFGMPCFSEDAGLVVEALGGRPGVLSARYAGLQKNPIDNLNKVLDEMKGINHRHAFFIALIAFYDGNEYKLFEGRVYGTLQDRSTGNEGFGYDPIFVPLGYNQTFGELNPDIKKLISHRTKATELFIDWIVNYK